MTASAHLDVLVVGGGPAALTISTALAEHNLAVGVLSSSPRRQPWSNTYGIWGAEVDALGLAHLLSHRWSDTLSHFGSGIGEHKPDSDGTVHHHRDYGLFDKQHLQEHWLSLGEHHGVQWWHDRARSIEHAADHSAVSTESGIALRARLVIDASGHKPVFVQKPAQATVAGQAAYGLVARFAKPPISVGQFVFMDYRCAHLSPEQRMEPPTFLYAMHLEEDIYFVEETSLALAPAVPFAVLQQRLQQRLSHAGAVIETVLHEEFCLFPMDPPLPDPLWYGFLTNTLSLGELAVAMARLFGLAPWDVRAGLLLPAQKAPAWQSATTVRP